ncbi:MAG TPA: hypothetical protein VLX92_35460 [Kofleriaceae bacterium]|nr:hypothetical protein [Kofleriaceae bacterium]
MVIALALAACHRGPKLPEGDIAATLAGAPVGEHAFDPQSVHGKPTLVMFVSPTCHYCMATIPRAIAAARQEDANIVAVFTAGQPQNARGVVSYMHFPGPAMVDDGTLVKRYHIDHVPYMFVLGADGHARDVLDGEQEQDAIADALLAAR